MKIKSVETEIVYIIETEDGEAFRRSGSMYWEKWTEQGWKIFPFETEIEGMFLSYKFEKREAEKRRKALDKIYENEGELGLDWE